MQMRCISLAVMVLLSACKTTEGKPLPPVADVTAAIEQKPKPPKAILTDPDASDRYNESVEAWGDRLRNAGGKLCAYFAGQGMAIDCRTQGVGAKDHAPSEMR